MPPSFYTQPHISRPVCVCVCVWQERERRVIVRILHNHRTIVRHNDDGGCGPLDAAVDDGPRCIFFATTATNGTL